jgi:hypothetical protein
MMMMTRRLTLDDIRYNPSTGWVTAAPVWAYAKGWPMAEVWAGVMRELQALAEASYEAEVRRFRESLRRVADGTAAEWEKQAFALMGVSQPVRATPRMLYRTRMRQYCRICSAEFFARLPTRYCSRRCLRARWKWRWKWRRRPSRARVKEDQRCRHCGLPFTPGRSDARYCSVRCRVAAHRTRRS